MMKELDKAQIDKLKEASQPVVVDTIDDIRQVLEPLLRDNTDTKPVIFDCSVAWQSKSGSETGVDNIKGYSNEATLYRMLVDGMDTIKKQMEVSQKAKQAAENESVPSYQKEIWEPENIHFSVDSLIRRRLGGTRHELRVRWVVREGCFEFDPYTKKLYQVEDDKSS